MESVETYIKLECGNTVDVKTIRSLVKTERYDEDFLDDIYLILINNQQSFIYLDDDVRDRDYDKLLDKKKAYEKALQESREQDD